jgi:glycosyltransferase involved in cell wall biosynthesis
MRILNVAEAFGGGLMEAAIVVAAESAARGHDVMIAHGVRPETPPNLRERIDPAVELEQLSWTERTPSAQLRVVRELRSLIGDWQPDVVHLHSSFAGVVGTAVVRGSLPTILCPQGFASAVPEGGAALRRGYRAIERAVCRNVTMVGAVSHSEAELARGYGAARVIRIPNGIPELDPEYVVTRPGGPDGPPTVVAAGRTVPQRQPRACARILSAIRDVAEPTWLGGGGGERGVAGRQALLTAGIPPTGWLPHADVMQGLAEAHVYVHWTAWDGLPLSVLEALALDVVVVASDIPPNREILGAEGVCRTEQEAVARIRRIIQDPDFAERQRERQRERRCEFSGQHMVDGWMAAYAEALGLPAEAPKVPAAA